MLVFGCDLALGSAAVNLTCVGCDPVVNVVLADRSGPSLQPTSGEEVPLAGEVPLHALGTVHTDPVPAKRGLFVIAEKHGESLKGREHTF